MTDPGMRRTTATDLAGAFVLVGVIVFVLLRFGYDSLPTLQFAIPIPITALAIIEFVAARRVRAAVRHDPNAKAMAAIVIARCVALGKASSLVASGVAGAATALVILLLPDVADISAARHDTLVGVLLLAASGLLAVGGLLLERAGVDPGSDERRR